jgi:DNA-3-methyladenine glycosylase
MRLGRPLSRRFFDRPCLEVAPDLIDCVLVRRQGDGTLLAARLVEVEAYLGDGSDPSAHSHGGPTPRNRSMFGPPGHLYAYRSYGIHVCVNVVCERVGSAAAVLLRAAEPVSGLDVMRANRGLGAERTGRAVASGPGRLAQAFGLGLEHDGASLLSGELRLYAPIPDREPSRVQRGPRVGISRAAALPYRFYSRDDPHVSAWRPGKRRSR